MFLIAACLANGDLGAAQSAPCDAPIDEAAFKTLVAGGVPAGRLRQLVVTCGVDSDHADAASLESRLKQLGVPAAALTALAPPATAESGTVWVSPIDRRQMVFIPAGEFRMGSEASEANREADELAHVVAIPKGFWMDTAEVSNESYRRFVISRPEWQKGNVSSDLKNASYLKNWVGNAYPDGQGDEPVVWVTWHAVRAYAAWAGKRLPTEAEWEYAARGGTTTRFWWGNIFDPQRAERDVTASSDPQLRTNGWGIRDGLGGVWEWTSSLYQPYPYMAADGREDPQAAGSRTTRGGSRVNAEPFLRSANRSLEGVSVASDLLGFRCVR